MKGRIGRVLLCAVLVVLSASTPLWGNEAKKPGGQVPAGAAAAEGGYLVGPGDVLDISVWKEEALTKAVVVLPDGTISFPLIGEIAAAGRTVAEIKEEVKWRIRKYAPDEVVSVEVKQVNSMVIYIIGRVNSPGRFQLNTNVNVLQALSIAGGLNPFAKRNDIKIFRQVGTATRVLHFRYDEVSEGQRLDQNVTMQRGDVIVVP
jgi:polysaccharide export outer membrane protein